MKQLPSFTGARTFVLGDEPRRGPRQRRQFRRRLLYGAAGLVVVAAAGGTFLYSRYGDNGKSTVTGNRPETAASAGLPPLALPPPDLLKPLTPEEALAKNQERPVSTRPDSPASAFRVTGDEASQMRAIDCLSQAVYYEAASEGVDGGRAVAQVVLNRMRHRAYPNSICGVVYQGSQRVTGCQFTFTCDGSLARVPVGYLWLRSRKIAAEALAGKVYAPVGHATSYHADYVLPYWADSLDKVAVIGRHIFYRLSGTVGAKSQFAGRYAGAEPLPPAPPTNVLPVDPAARQDPAALTPLPPEPKVEEDRIEAIAAGNRAAVGEQRIDLAADLARGTLIIGEPDGTAAKKKSAATGTAKSCVSGNDGPVKAIRADDLRAGASTTDC